MVSPSSSSDGRISAMTSSFGSAVTGHFFAKVRGPLWAGKAMESDGIRWNQALQHLIASAPKICPTNTDSEHWSRVMISDPDWSFFIYWIYCIKSCSKSIVGLWTWLHLQLTAWNPLHGRDSRRNLIAAPQQTAREANGFSGNPEPFLFETKQQRKWRIMSSRALYCELRWQQTSLHSFLKPRRKNHLHIQRIFLSYWCDKPKTRQDLVGSRWLTSHNVPSQNAYVKKLNSIIQSRPKKIPRVKGHHLVGNLNS